MVTSALVDALEIINRALQHHLVPGQEAVSVSTPDIVNKLQMTRAKDIQGVTMLAGVRVEIPDWVSLCGHNCDPQLIISLSVSFGEACR